jgi:hypothetical protein
LIAVTGGVVAAGALAPWLLTASCGGTQAPAPAASSDAAADAGVATSEDACAIQSAYSFRRIVGFENDNPADLAPSNTSTNPSYVSFDLTGGMFACTGNCGTRELADFYGVDAAPPHGVPVSSLQCMTGYNPIAEKLPNGDTGHCLVDGGTATQGLHLRAVNLTNWGMNLGVELRQNCNNTMDPNAPPSGAQPCYFDAGGWTGISFWARIGTSDVSLSAGGVLPAGPSVTNAILTIGDPQTSGALGGIYPDNPMPPICGDTPCVMGQGPPTVHGAFQCDPFGKAVTLSTDWQFYRVPFSDMTQKGYGLPESAPDLTHFLGLKFNLSRGQIGSSDYDVWVNDFAFYK